MIIILGIIEKVNLKTRRILLSKFRKLGLKLKKFFRVSPKGQKANFEGDR
jgi:hypothetical protein